MKDVYGLNNVRPLTAVRPLQDVTGLQTVAPLSFDRTGYSRRAPKVNVVDTTPEKADSLLDVLLGSDQRDELLKEEGLESVKDIPVLNLIAGSLSLVKDKYVDPFIENGITGQAFKEIGINTLIEISEDLDIFSNIIKSQFPSAGGGFGLETLADSLGLNGKRVVYNFNTGSTLKDIGLEVITDPLTLFELGASAVGSLGKTGAKGTAAATTKALTSELSEQATKDFAKAITKTVIQQGEEATFENVIKNVSRRSLNEIAQAGLKQSTPQIIEATLKSKGYKMFNAASKFKASVEAVDKAITKAAWFATPVGLPAKYLGPALKEQIQHIYNNVILNIEKYDLTKNFVKKQGAFKEALETAMLQNKALNETIFKNNAHFFRTLNIDETTLQQYFYAMLKQLEKTNADIDIYEAFIDFLIKKNKRFSLLFTTNNTVFMDYIKSDGFKELIDATSVAPRAILQAEKELTSKYHQATYNSMKKYIKQHSDNLEDIYNYIDETVLGYNGKHFGLVDLDGFLNEIITDKTTSKEYLNNIATLLESVGINRNNAQNIDRILKSRVKDKNKALRILLDNSNKSAKLLEFKDYDKMLQTATNKLKDTTEQVLNNVWKENIAKYNVGTYSEIRKNSIKNMQDAVTRIQNNEDVQHAIAYIKNYLRLQDLPEYKETAELMNTLLEQNNKVPKKEIQYVDRFLKETERIMSSIEKADVVLDVPKWWDSLERTQNVLNKLQNTLYEKGGPYAVAPRARILRLIEALDTFKEKEFVDALVNYIDDLNGMVHAQLSHLGMFNVLIQHTHLTDDTDLRFFMDQMSNPDSIYRQRTIPSLIEGFEKAGMPAKAQDVRKVVAQIDTVTNLYKLLSIDIPTPFKLSNKTQADLRNIVFDVIDNHKSYTISDILSDEVAQSYTEKIKDIEPRTLRQILRDSIDYGVDSKTVTDRIAKDAVGIDIKIAKQQVKERLYTILDDYINAQARLGSYIDNVSLSTLYDLSTVETLELTNKIRFQLAGNNANVSLELLNAYDTTMADFYRFSEAIKEGVEDVKEINKKLATPISSLDATIQLKSICESYNLYSGSIESNMYAAKYIIENSYGEAEKHFAGFEERFKLTPKDFIGSNQELLMIKERLWSYRDILHDSFKYEDDYIESLRQALITTYSRPNALFAPRNPMEYFNSLEPQYLLAWEVATKGNLSINNKTAFYNALNATTQTKYANKVTKADVIAKLEAITRNPGFVDSDALANVANIARETGAMEYANKYIDANLMYTLHSLEDLGKYKEDLVIYLKNDVAALDDIVKTITSIENDPAIRMTYDDFGNPEDLRNLGGTNYGYKEVLYRNQETMYQERKSAQALSITAMDAEELATHIYRQTPGAMVFHNSNIIKVQNIDGSTTWTGIDNPFNFTPKELKNAGLKIEKIVDEDGEWFLIRLTDNRVHNKTLKYADLGTSHLRIQQRYTDLIDKYRLYLNMYEVEDIPTNIITVETLNEDTWNEFIKKHLDFFGDAEEQKLYQKYNKWGRNTFFDKSFSRLNFTVVGGFDTYNIWNGKNSETFIKHSTQMSSNTMAGLTSAINRSNKINKYLTMFFNNDYALDNPLFKTMFSEANDKRIAQFFAEGKYKVAILRKDKQGLPKVFEYAVNNRASLDKATAAGGIMVPAETYNAMKQVVNKRQMTNSLLDVYRRVVPSTYKSMYLFTAGFPFRNGLDSLIFKNANELGGITALPSVFKYEREASKALELHNKIQQEVFELTGGETFNKKDLLKVLSKYTPEEVDIYYLTDLFKESAASGSLSESMQTFLENFNRSNNDDIRALWEKFYEDKVLFGKQWYNPLYHLRNLNEHIEQTARMGLFLASVDEGLPINEAIARVVKTHFDYNSGGDLLDICERIFWFSTFPINNFNYYVNGGLTKSPTMIKLVMDTQVASWNNGEYTYEELKKTNFLAYHALVGSIRIGDWIVKTSPSLFDFINLVTDVPGNLKDRLNPFIAIPMGLSENPEEDILPWISQVRNYKKFMEGNPVPSILSKINSQDWERTMYRWRNHYQYSNWTRYPRIKRATAYKKYLRKYYSRRYRTSVRKFTRTSLYHDAINYYRVTKRGPTYRDL